MNKIEVTEEQVMRAVISANTKLVKQLTKDDKDGEGAMMFTLFGTLIGAEVVKQLFDNTTEHEGEVDSGTNVY